MLKGPWTHHPDAEPLLYVLERCNACCMLIDRVRAEKAVLGGLYLN